MECDECGCDTDHKEQERSIGVAKIMIVDLQEQNDKLRKEIAEARADERKKCVDGVAFRQIEEDIRQDERRKCEEELATVEVERWEEYAAKIKKEAYANATFACEQKCASKCKEIEADAFRRGQADLIMSKQFADALCGVLNISPIGIWGIQEELEAAIKKMEGRK